MSRPRPAITTIEVHKGTGTRYHSTLVRTDGVTVALDGGSFNRVGGSVDRVPHDIAHLVVEEALGLRRGLWGVLAAGGLVQNATFAGGRLPPDGRRRAARISRDAGAEPHRAEILVRVAADTAARGGPGDLTALRRRVGEEHWSPALTAAALTRITADLRAAAARWDALAPGAAYGMTWREP